MERMREGGERLGCENFRIDMDKIRGGNNWMHEWGEKKGTTVQTNHNKQTKRRDIEKEAKEKTKDPGVTGGHHVVYSTTNKSTEQQRIHTQQKKPHHLLRAIAKRKNTKE